tara:strand:+ start:839 stop:1102 length:264 start_codon:yes stop_codon:yes gene_type:complete
MITISQDNLNEIAENTKDNCHGENYEMIAKLLNLKNITAALTDINIQHRQLGSLTPYLSHVRDEKRRVLMNHCRERVTNFKELYDAL